MTLITDLFSETSIHWLLVIDRLELLVPAHFPQIREFWIKHRGKPAKSGQPYQTTVDVRRSFSLSIHYGHRTPVPPGRRHYKLDFTNTRLLTVHDVVWRICSIFDVSHQEALALKVARIDFAADVAGTPVQWFKEFCRVRHKRTSSTYAPVKSETVQGTTTIVFGKRPDLYRIYDRIAEKRHRGRDILYDGLYIGAPMPVITRVERQCNGRAIPLELATLGALIDNGAEFDPFQNLICTVGAKEIPFTDDWTPQRWLMSLGLSCAVHQFGEAQVRSRLNRTGNAQRILSKYSELLTSEGIGPSREQLRDLYRASTWRQFNRPETDTDGNVTYPQGGLVWLL